MTLASPATFRMLLANSVIQIAGRLLLSMSRLVVAMVIVRLSGSDQFGEYVLMLTFLAIVEWLLDFGQTDFAVRDISRADASEGSIIGGLTRLKLVQGLVLMPMLPIALYLANYPAPMVRAGAIGSLGLPFLAGVLVFRARFKAHLKMGKDVVAEVAGVAAMLVATWLACSLGAGIEALIGVYVLGRAVFFVTGLILLRGLPSIRMGTGGGQAGWILLWEAVPLGLIGLMVGISDGMAPVALSKLTTLHEVATYAGASRYTFLVIIIVQALNTAFFPLLSNAWPGSPRRLTSLMQMALEASVMLGVGMTCGLYASAEFLMRLLGPGMLDGVAVLRFMCGLILVRTISTAMSPLIFVAGRQSRAAWITGFSVLLEVAAMWVLVPRYGAMGAVASYLFVELATGAIVISLMGQHVSGAWLRWSVPLRLMLCGVVAIFVSRYLPFSGSLLSGIMCCLIYLALSFASGGISVMRIQNFMEEMHGFRAGAAVRTGGGEL
jgi:O-antigen/teichoic acid export membrane protein